jgi:hypothetical protein
MADAHCTTFRNHATAGSTPIGFSQRCRVRSALRGVQAKLRVSQPGDASEHEADRVADSVMAAPGRSIQMKCASCEEEEKHEIRRKSTGPESDGLTVGEDVVSTLGPGQPLDAAARGFFEPRFGVAFHDVRVHDGAAAAESARTLNARAYTLGKDIVFGTDEYQTQTDEGKRLLAHELTHVIQQQGGIQAQTIQRDCADADFCTPYPTPADAADAESNLRSYYLPVEEAKFGSNSRALYESFLSRSPGDSLAPTEFNDPASDVVSSFAESSATDNDQDAIIDIIGDRLSRVPGGPLRDYTPSTMSIANFLSQAEMDERPINYSNPLSIAGHIAGGIGSSDAGVDYRKVWGNVTLEKIPLIGSTGYIHAETTLHYEVFDAIDFCPGDCGSPAEQLITIPMSRLEAGGEAYDVPFKVTFMPDSRSKRFFYS